MATAPTPMTLMHDDDKPTTVAIAQPCPPPRPGNKHPLRGTSDIQPSLADKSEGPKPETSDFLVFAHIWMLGRAETVPRHISRFHFLHFESQYF